MITGGTFDAVHHHVTLHVEHLDASSASGHHVQHIAVHCELEVACSLARHADTCGRRDALQVIHIEVVEFRLEFVRVTESTDDFPGDFLDVSPVEVNLSFSPARLLEFGLSEGNRGPFSSSFNPTVMEGEVSHLTVLKLDGMTVTLIAVADSRAVGQVNTLRGVSVQVNTKSNERIIRERTIFPRNSFEANNLSKKFLRGQQSPSCR